MSIAYNFKRITVVPTAAELKDAVLSKTQRKTPTVVHRRFAIGRIRSFYARKVKFLQQTLHDKLTQVINEFPKMEEIHPFYCDLMNILYDRDHYKIALGQMNTARHLVDGIAREYVRLLKYADSLYRCKMLKRAALGRMVKLLRRNKASFEYLEQVRQHLSRLPSIDPNTRTLILCGFPNVGKSSFVNAVTRADVEVQPYAFTTKSLYVGHLDYKYLRWQVIDTPGILDHPLEERNTIEMQAVTALAHLKSAVLFIMDVSEQCDKSISEQIALFDSIRPLFANKPVIVGLNKVDVVRREQLAADRKEALEKLEKSGVPIVEMSTITKEGLVALRDKACDALLAQRVEAKLSAKKTSIANDGGVLSRVFVAYPEKRDNKARDATIPQAVWEKRQRAAQRRNDDIEVDADDKDELHDESDKRSKRTWQRVSRDLAQYRDPNLRKLEREIELELADEYVLDLKKHYLLKNPDEKYDVIPEIWEGHNIADFVDPDIEKKLAELEEEERLREEAGEYDELESDDEETKQQLKLARLIRDKEQLARAESRLNKRTTNQRASRSITRKRTRTVDALEQQMGSLGVRIKATSMERLQEQQSRSISAKRIKVGHERSVSAKRSASRDVQGIPDPVVRDKAKKLGRKSQRPLNRLAKKGEADRHIGTKKPKHLFAGKRGIGKTDRR